MNTITHDYVIPWNYHVKYTTDSECIKQMIRKIIR